MALPWLSPKEVTANGESFYPAVSPDGNFVAFISSADNIVPNDNNGSQDAFLKNLLTGEIKRVSISSHGVEGNCHSSNVDVSENGKFVAFVSCADNLVDNDTNGLTNVYGPDVFVHDVDNGVTERVSIASDGTEMMGFANFYPSISNDGRFVSFSAQAENLHPDDHDNVLDVFVHDRMTDETKLVSIDSEGNANNGSNGRHDYLASISGDGNHVVFFGYSHLDKENYVGKAIFIHNIQTGKTRLVGGTGGISSLPSVSKDGSWVAFVSTMKDVMNFTSEKYTFQQLYIKNMNTGEIVTVINPDENNPIYSGATREVSLSEDGLYVVFHSYLDDLVANDTNNKPDMFRFNRITGEIIRISELDDGTEVNFNGYGTGQTTRHAVSADGSVIVFTSDSNDFVSNDGNGTTDVFVNQISTDSGQNNCTTDYSETDLVSSYNQGYSDGYNQASSNLYTEEEVQALIESAKQEATASLFTQEEVNVMIQNALAAAAQNDEQDNTDSNSSLSGELKKASKWHKKNGKGVLHFTFDKEQSIWDEVIVDNKKKAQIKATIEFPVNDGSITYTVEGLIKIK